MPYRSQRNAGNSKSRQTTEVNGKIYVSSITCVMRNILTLLYASEKLLKLISIYLKEIFTEVWTDKLLLYIFPIQKGLKQ
jgi:hypothetical protein